MAIYHSSALLPCTFIAHLPAEKKKASSFFKNEIRLSWRLKQRDYLFSSANKHNILFAEFN